MDKSSGNNVTWGSNITEIGKGAFNKTPLTEVDLSSNTSLTTLNGFSNCTELVSMIYPSSITSIGESCFEGSTKLTKVRTSSMTDKDGVYLSNSIASVKNSAFSGCKSITIVKSLCTGELYLGQHAFRTCTSLALFSQDTSGSLKYESEVFSYDTALKAVILPSGFDMSSTIQLVPSLTQFSSNGDAFVCFSNGKSYYEFTGDLPTWMKINDSYNARIAYYTGNGKKSDGTYAANVYEWKWNTDESQVVCTLMTNSSSSSIISPFYPTIKKEERLS